MTEVDSRQHVLFVRVQLLCYPSGPTFNSNLVGLAGVPDVHGTEVGTGRIRISDAVNHSDFALVVEAFDWPHAGHEAQLVIDFD